MLLKAGAPGLCAGAVDMTLAGVQGGWQDQVPEHVQRLPVRVRQRLHQPRGRQGPRAVPQHQRVRLHGGRRAGPQVHLRALRLQGHQGRLRVSAHPAAGAAGPALDAGPNIFTSLPKSEGSDIAAYCQCATHAACAVCDHLGICHGHQLMYLCGTALDAVGGSQVHRQHQGRVRTRLWRLLEGGLHRQRQDADVPRLP